MKPLKNMKKPSLRSFLFWDVTQHWLLVSYWCCRTTYQSHCQGWSSLIGCPKMLVTNYKSMLFNIPEQRRSHLRCGKSWNHETMVIYRCSIWNPLVTLQGPHQCLIPPIFDEVYVSACLLYCLCDVTLQLMEGCSQQWWKIHYILHESRD